MVTDLSTELCILGASPACCVTAIRAAQLGAKVILIERAEVEGTCLNVGCIPTKALLRTAESLEIIKKANEVGVSATVLSVILENAVIRKDIIVKGLKIGLNSLFK